MDQVRQEENPGSNSRIARWLGPGARPLSRYQVSVAATPARTYDAALGASLRDMPLARVLFRLRGIPYARDATLHEFFSTLPFLVLEEDPQREVVFGVAGRSGRVRGSPGAASGRRRPSTPEEFRAFTDEGVIRAVGNFRVEMAPAGSVLSTETWIETFGLRAGRLFRLYWLFIGPFSGLIRREFLRVARSRAEGRSV